MPFRLWTWNEPLNTLGPLAAWDFIGYGILLYERKSVHVRKDGAGKSWIPNVVNKEQGANECFIILEWINLKNLTKKWVEGGGMLEWQSLSLKSFWGCFSKLRFNLL